MPPARPAFRRAASAASASAALTAASRPPDVWGSKRMFNNASSPDRGPMMNFWRNPRLRPVPPGIVFRSAYSRAEGSSGTAAESIRMLNPDSDTISQA